MNYITRSAFNNKFFYDMQKEELEECMKIIKTQIDTYQPSISGICISDQEHQQELWDAWRNINHCLSNLTKG
jgi:hypothetical protein